MKYTFDLGNYHQVAGIQVPARVKLGGDTAESKVEINPGYDPSIFSTPPSPDAGIDTWRKRGAASVPDDEKSRGLKQERALPEGYGRMVTFVIFKGVTGWLAAPSPPMVVCTLASASTAFMPDVTRAKIT